MSERRHQAKRDDASDNHSIGEVRFEMNWRSSNPKSTRTPPQILDWSNQESAVADAAEAEAALRRAP
jgi:hypothetical protein